LNHRLHWLLLVFFALACATRGAPASSSAASPLAFESAPSMPESALDAGSSTSPSDHALRDRGLSRTDAQTQVPPPNWTEARASLYILARTLDGQVALVGGGARLHSGEQIELHVSVGLPSYVYLIQISAHDKATILYPIPGEPEKMLPDIDYRMPTNANVRFVLDNEVGTERLAFVVMAEPLASGDADVRAMLERLQATNQWSAALAGAAPSSRSSGTGAVPPVRAATETHAAPGHGSGATRGFVRNSAGTGRALDVQPDDRGVAIALFTFEHVP
jgi:hypothetical protein